MGCIGPYMAQELTIRDAYPIGILLALPSLSNLFAGPIWGIVSDRTQSWAKTLKLASWTMFFGLVLLNVLPSAYLIIAMFFHAIGRTSIAPLIDSLIIQDLGENQKDYGKKRVWGSIGFALGALLGSLMQSYLQISLLPLALFPGVLFLLSLKNIKEPPPLPVPNLSKALRFLLKDMKLFALLFAGILHFMPLIATDIFLAIHLKSLHIDPMWTGLAICSGILVEVVILKKTGDWMHVIFSPLHLFLMAILAGIIHWTSMIFVRDPLLIMCIQGLHGFEFGFFWLAIVDIISKKTTEIPATGQTILNAAIGGCGAGGGIYIASWIVESYSTKHMFQWGAVLEIIALCIVLVLIWRQNNEDL